MARNSTLFQAGFSSNSGYSPDNPWTEAYIYDMVKQETIVFPYMPFQFSENKSANYSLIPILGRSEPILGYSSSGPRQFNLTLTFAADSPLGIEGGVSVSGSGIDAGVNTISPAAQVIYPLRLIRSWVYPDYLSQDFANVPPRLEFVVGRWLRQRCVCFNYSINYIGPWGRAPVSTQDEDMALEAMTDGISESLWDLDVSEIVDLVASATADSMTPYRAEVTITLIEVSENSEVSPYDHRQVAVGGDRGTGKAWNGDGGIVGQIIGGLTGGIL